MTERPGVPARELTDDELERQGVHAHAMRHRDDIRATLAARRA